MIHTKSVGLATFGRAVSVGVTSNSMPRNTLRDLHGHCELLE